MLTTGRWAYFEDLDVNHPSSIDPPRTHVMRRRMLAAVAALALLPTLVLAQAPGKASVAAGPTSHRTIDWEELTPKGWDPMKDLRDLKAGGAPMSDADPRAEAMLKRLREAWANAPTNNALDGAAVRLPGYLVPLEDTPAGMKEFLLVPYFGACIHTPPPPANQIVHVFSQTPARGLRSMDAVWVSGTLKLSRTDTGMGVSGYRMDAVRVAPYVAGAR